MVKTCVQGSGINKIRQPQLLDPAQALKVGVLKQLEHQFIRHRNETVNGIIEDLMLGWFYHGVKVVISCESGVRSWELGTRSRFKFCSFDR